jgi:hypothetical protein
VDPAHRIQLQIVVCSTHHYDSQGYSTTEINPATRAQGIEEHHRIA